MKLRDKMARKPWRENLGKTATNAVFAAVSMRARFVSILLFLVFILILSYYQAWRPLAEEASLPPPVLPTNPEIDIESIKSIVTEKAERVQRVKPDYSVYLRVLVVAPLDEIPPE